VTFIDPDDWIDDGYLDTVATFLDRNPATVMVATNRVYFEESHQRRRDGHPLRQMFRSDRLVDLNDQPEYFHSSAPAAFFLRSLIAQVGLRFDTRIRPIFEDGHFCVRYLLECDEPLVAFLGSAQYVYRRRSDLSSTLQGSLAHPGRFSDVPRFGYLDALERGSARDGRAPRWVQNLVLYELSWFFSADAKAAGAHTAGIGALGAEFVELLARIVSYLDDDAIESFAVRRYEEDWRMILRHGIHPEDWHSDYAVVDRTRTDSVRLCHRFVGRPPSERVLVDHVPVDPIAAKTRTLRYFDQPLLHERIHWVPAGAELELDGRIVEVRTSWGRPGVTPEHRPPGRFGSVIRRARRRTLSSLTRRVGVKLWRTATEWTVPRLAASRPVRRRFAECWVLMDRTHDANDNAEYLFRFLRDERPDVNAWFTLERDTPDWHRMHAADSSRLVAYGSLTWKLMMLNCAHLVTSHAERSAVCPPTIESMRAPGWRTTCLNHGVIERDESRTYAGVPIDLFVVSTERERQSIAGDGNGYDLTMREVQLTGMPRLDVLRAAGGVTRSERNVVLIAPTWRHWLVPPSDVSPREDQASDRLRSSEFACRWAAVASSPRLHDLADELGLEIGLLPHPDLDRVESFLDDIPGTTRHRFSSADLPRVFARTAVLITDYSSMAWNVAYLGRPTIYYRFDEDQVFDGGHVGRVRRPSQQQLFGPSTADADELLDQVEALLRRGHADAPYLHRIETAFALHDGRCRARVADAIAGLE
ncbi:CDP-glycerol glycerophosphotransferase family protein, partial [Ilumatobacter sp.]|uniref:CDP-glycerol glycerophosphotransferase family protein n=1 Tax=Ilumatobacter sp. TaxID=1967498 RepID=UPI003C487F72